MRTILIVDDEQNVRDGLLRTLRRSGLDAECRTADNGRMALEKVISEGADVVVSDVNMPGMDGIELLTRLRADVTTQHIPVIMLTGNDEGEIRRTALDLGAFDFLIKPTDPVELVARLRNALRTKGYEDELRERNQLFEDQIVQLQRLENLSFMAAGIIHDLNGGLTVISGHIQIIKLGIREGMSIQHSLDSMTKAVGNAQGLISRILDMSRQEDPLPQACSISDIVTDTLSILGHTVRGRIDLLWEKPEDSGTVAGHLFELRQMVMNLCVNAIQAIEGHGTIEVTLETAMLGENRQDRLWRLAPGEYARLRVSDTGAGISPDCIDQVFKPFYTSKPAGQGTGLGLCVVDRAIRSHNGAIIIDSTPGTGTVFNVYLPRVLGIRDTENLEGASRHAQEERSIR